MYKWATIFKDFHKAQMLIGSLENQVTLTREEFDDSLWMTVDDYSPAQRKYDDLHDVEIEFEERPF
jgi:hypothetical protein